MPQQTFNVTQQEQRDLNALAFSKDRSIRALGSEAIQDLLRKYRATIKRANRLLTYGKQKH